MVARVVGTGIECIVGIVRNPLAQLPTHRTHREQADMHRRAMALLVGHDAGPRAGD